jgi:polyhydroxybutyrate depolymerase
MTKTSDSGRGIGRALLGALGVGAVAAGLLAREIRRSSGTIFSGGLRRSYLLHVPKSYQPAKTTPLVISIHGYAEWPGHQAQISRWTQLADEHGFLVVFPAGTKWPMRWRTRGEPGSEMDPMIDVCFISDLIDILQERYSIDPRRIYANGLSNGGGMSFALACKLSERIAAIGSVSGAYLTPWSDSSASRPVPLIAFHGTHDPVVPYQGGPSRSFNLPFPVVPDWIAEYAYRNGCEGAPIELLNAGAVRGIRYRGSSPEAEVIFYTIEGGGHTWPGSRPMPEWLVGRTDRDADATRMMWKFFQSHPMS